jgi:hypothetical protein
MSTPVGEKTLATVPLDDLARHLDPGYECLEGGQGHCAARRPPPERLVRFGGVDAVQPDELIGHDDRIAVDDLGAAGQAITPSARA